jgi:hypothetical protein
MPVDKKHFIELKFSRLSPSVRKSLKKLSLTELSELADQINKVSGTGSSAPISVLKELFGELEDRPLDDSKMSFSYEEVKGWNRNGDED